MFLGVARRPTELRPLREAGTDHAGGYLFGGISASYTDLGANGQPPLTAVAQATIQLRRQQAEFAQIKQGVSVATTNDAGGGQHVTGIDNGDYIAFRPINLGDADTVTFRYASGSSAAASTSVGGCTAWTPPAKETSWARNVVPWVGTPVTFCS